MNLILGRMNLMIVLQTGNKMSMASTLNTRPAPRENQTEYCNLLRPARRASDACFHLLIVVSVTLPLLTKS